eukprot:1555153-Rhodomonas_salina.1
MVSQTELALVPQNLVSMVPQNLLLVVPQNPLSDMLWYSGTSGQNRTWRSGRVGPYSFQYWTWRSGRVGHYGGCCTRSGGARRPWDARTSSACS